MTDDTKNQPLWQIMETLGPPKPLTFEDIQRSFDALTERLRQDPPKQRRFVSPAVYKRAEDAIANGATPQEVELVLCGATLDEARAIIKEWKDAR